VAGVEDCEYETLA